MVGAIHSENDKSQERPRTGRAGRTRKFGRCVSALVRRVTATNWVSWFGIRRRRRVTADRHASTRRFRSRSRPHRGFFQAGLRVHLSPSTCRALAGHPRRRQRVPRTATGGRAPTDEDLDTDLLGCPPRRALWQPCTCRRSPFPRLDCPRPRRWSAAPTSLCSRRGRLRAFDFPSPEPLGAALEDVSACGVSSPRPRRISRNAACRLIALSAKNQCNVPP